MTTEYEEHTITQNRGPTVAFAGKLLASDEFETRGHDPMRMRFEIWETRGGALIAASYSEPAGRKGFEDARVAVVEPQGIAINGVHDDPAMRFAVLEHFGWDNRARAMARKLGWSLRQEVE